MLQKLRSRHPVDVPAEQWKRRTPTLAILGSIAVLFVLIPILVSLFGGGRFSPIPVIVGGGILILVLLGAAAKGKPGWNR